MTFNRFAAGRKIYGQGSYAPTKGQLNPQGYIQREVKRRNQQALGANGGVSQVGNDGQSDTRSGLAKFALGKRNPNRIGAQQSKGINPGRQSAQNMQVPGQRNGQQVAPQPQTVGTQPVSTQPAPAPQVNVNSTGQLELPYGSEYANMALDAQMAYDAEILALQQEEQQQAAAYQTNIKDLDQSYTTQKAGTLNQNASAGTAFSSAYGVGVNEDSRNFQNMRNSLDTENTNFKTNVETRRSGAMNNLKTLLQRATQGYADSLAEDAGSLGYGTDAVEVPSPVGASGGGRKGKKNNGGHGNGNGGKGKHKPKAMALSQEQLKNYNKKGKKK